MKPMKKTNSAISVWMAALLLAACAAGNYGVLRTNPEVERTFKARQALEGHTYYYYGWIGEPDAVIGIHEDYTLESNRWIRVDLEETPVGLLMDRMTRRDPTNFRGAVLKDPDGNRMGVWFSDSPGATIGMAGDKRIAYITPYPRRIERDDDDRVRPGIGGGVHFGW
jgi:ATP-dependent exoDNAse (exonuclease V) alpha subunit